MTRRRRSVGSADDGKQAVLPLDSPTKATPLLPPAADSRDAIIADLRAQLVAANARAERAEARADRMEGRLEQMMAKLDRLDAANEQRTIALTPVPSKPWITPRQLLPMYQAWVLAEREKKSKCTILSVLRRLMESELADKPIDQLTWMDLDAHKARRRAQTTRLGGPPADVTIDQEICYLQTMLNWGSQPGRRGATGMSHNPLSGYPQMKAAERRKLKRKKIYTYQEEWAILACAPSPFLRALTLLVGNFSRPLEALSTERDQFVEHEDGSGMLKLKEEQTKNDEEREIPLPKVIMDALRELPTWSDGSRYAFENKKTGKPYSLRWMDELWARARDLAGVEGKGGRPAELYSMRHTGATRALNEAGISIAVIAEMMGHKDWKQLERTYVHIQDDAKLRAVQLMEQIRAAALEDRATDGDGDRKPPKRADRVSPTGGRVSLLPVAKKGNQAT